MGRNRYPAAQPEIVDGMRFPSRLEAAYYKRLKEIRDHGDGKLLYFLRQCPLHLAGGVKYVVDFVEFWDDGRVVYTDTKGRETPTFKLKRRMVEATYPITINVVTRVDRKH